MASFRESDQERLDWHFMQCGPIALFHKMPVLDGAIAWLTAQQYSVVTVDCGTRASKHELVGAMCATMGFEITPFPNLNGLSDYCWQLDVSDEGGFAIALTHFDQVAKNDRELAENLLDIFAQAAWNKLLLGRRFLCLVQSDDPGIKFPPVGGHVPWWNDREWLHKDRGL